MLWDVLFGSLEVQLVMCVLQGFYSICTLGPAAQLEESKRRNERGWETDKVLHDLCQLISLQYSNSRSLSAYFYCMFGSFYWKQLLVHICYGMLPHAVIIALAGCALYCPRECIVLDGLYCPRESVLFSGHK